MNYISYNCAKGEPNWVSWNLNKTHFGDALRSSSFYRYMLLEAGHVGQNLTLTAVALNLGVCSLGGFFDDELGELLRLDAREQPLLYCLAVGVPESGDRDHLRFIEA